jgi:hypothetical protein
MSRREGESTSKDDRSRAHPGRGRFLRGSTWAIGDYTPSKHWKFAERSALNGFDFVPMLLPRRRETSQQIRGYMKKKILTTATTNFRRERFQAQQLQNTVRGHQSQQAATIAG